MDGQWERLVDPVTGSNCYIIGLDGGCLIIDPNSFSGIDQAMQKWNTRPTLVCLTHEHCDHIGGLNELRARYPVLVAASAACSLGIQDTRENMSRRMELFLYYKSGETRRVSYPPFACRAADLTFGTAVDLPFAGEWVRMVSLPGHTRGSSVISYRGGVFCGDYLLPGDQVLTRLPGGSEEDYRRYARPWLRAIPDGTWLFPGHGEPFQMSEKVRIAHEL